MCHAVTLLEISYRLSWHWVMREIHALEWEMEKRSDMDHSAPCNKDYRRAFVSLESELSIHFTGRFAIKNI